MTPAKRSGFLPLLMNDLFDDRFFFPDLGTDLLNEGLSVPMANIEETEKDFRVELSAPGLKKDDLKVEVENGMLVISAEKKEESKENKKNYKRREFSYNSFTRSFLLPENVKEDQINAKYEDGILRVSIPKKEVSVSKPKKQIQVA